MARWGSHQLVLPKQLLHQPCGHAFLPLLVCSACGERAGVNDLSFALLAKQQPRQRAVRLAHDGAGSAGLGLRVDRWAILIVSSLLLRRHYFDEISHTLGIGSSVLASRLAGMVDAGLLICQDDVGDARRKIYRLTPASRDLFGYIMCFSSWASRYHFQQPSSIAPTHKACGQPFVPRVVCSHCHGALDPREVTATA